MQLMSSAGMVTCAFVHNFCIHKGQSLQISTAILSRPYNVLRVLQTAGNHWKQLLGSFLQCRQEGVFGAHAPPR